MPKKLLAVKDRERYGFRWRSKLTWQGGAMLDMLRTSVAGRRQAWVNLQTARRNRVWHSENDTERYWLRLEARIAGYPAWKWVPDSVFSETDEPAEARIRQSAIRLVQEYTREVKYTL